MSEAFDPSTSPFLSGLMAPVQDERDDRALAVEGELPAGLNGMFVRNGPNPQFPPIDAYHPFDGDGMVHALYFEDGKVRYRNRFIESAGLLAERKRGRACYGSLSKFRMPEPDVIAEAGGMKNSANTHFVRHANRYLALMEAGPPTELTRELETVGVYDWKGKLRGPMTAHPKIDPKSGEMIFFGYSPIPPYLIYHVADPDGRLVHNGELDLEVPVLMHDFAVTEHHAVFFDSPAVFDPVAMMNGQPGMRWEPERGTRIGILPRRGQQKDIRWFDVPNAYVVHVFNAFDDGDTVHVYAPSFDEMPGGLQFDKPEQSEEPMPSHWAIDLASGAVKFEQTDDRPGEFPRINDLYATRRHRYMYNSRARDWEFGFNFNGVIKYDLESDATQEFLYRDSEVCGEHIFVPEPGGRNEDDGWVMSVVSDRETEQSALAILDARALGDGPVARVKFPRRVPIGFHANWLPDPV